MRQVGWLSTLVICWALAPSTAGADDHALTEVQALKAPTGTDSTSYSLTQSDDGDVLLSWVEKKPDIDSLRFSRLRDGKWTKPRTVADGADWFVNWVDRPAIVINGQVLLAYWLERPLVASGAASGYGLRVIRSEDGGLNWEPAFDVGLDNRADYTGFGAFQPVDDGFLMAYLHPLREGARQGLPADRYVKTLRLVDISMEGDVRSDILLDGDVCTCCPLGIAQTSSGPAVVYRDHEPGEIRDISIVRRVGENWTRPQTVHPDGWTIHGCPTNGPAIAADGQFVAVAWFTYAGNEPRVRLAFSNDGGANFGPPKRVDEGNALGWANVSLTPAGDAAVSWLEKNPGGKGKGRLLLRIVGTSGLGPVVKVADTPAGRGAGIPGMARQGRHLVLAWKGKKGVRTARVSLDP